MGSPAFCAVSTSSLRSTNRGKLGNSITECTQQGAADGLGGSARKGVQVGIAPHSTCVQTFQACSEPNKPTPLHCTVVACRLQGARKISSPTCSFRGAAAASERSSG